MDDGHEHSDEELARAAKRGDDAAFDLLVRRYLRRAMGLAWQFTRRLEDAEDVVQEAFHRAVRALGDYDAQRPFGPWFYAIVRNAAKNAIAKDERRRALAPTASIESDLPASAGADPAEVADVERAVEALAPMQQACIRLCDVEGFTSREASGMLGITEGTVRTHLHRARAQLRASMGVERGMLP